MPDYTGLGTGLGSDLDLSGMKKSRSDPGPGTMWSEMPELTLAQWLLAILGAAGLGIGKAGLSGMSLLHVLIFAFLFGARDSTGIVLPMLLVGDVCAVTAYHQHARWDYVRRMLPPACLGVIAAAAVMRGLDDAAFKPTIGWIIFTLSLLQVARMQRPDWFGDVPHSRMFAWTMGLAAGALTMLQTRRDGLRALPRGDAASSSWSAPPRGYSSSSICSRCHSASGSASFTGRRCCSIWRSFRRSWQECSADGRSSRGCRSNSSTACCSRSRRSPRCA
jgi:hypothetical protein